MKILYLDLGMGAAGDMLAGALLALLDEDARKGFLRRLNALLPDAAAADAGEAAQCGVTGTRFRVRIRGEEEGEPAHAHEHAHEHEHEHSHAHHHAHAGLAEIWALVDDMGLAEAEKADVLAVYEAVAAAESEVHGVPVTEIHFHELGALDALADVTAVTLLLRQLAPERIVASPVAVGSGTVRCAHGILPVPAPATALLLRGVPCYAGDVKGELCTPTGAALLKHFATDFGPLPVMTPLGIGCGFGTKEFPERPNCVRAVLGDAEIEAAEQIVELQCNVDDMTPEAVGYALERLYAAGAVEVFTVGVGMKKNRPGVLLTAICRREAKEAVLRAIFAHTTTLGVREYAPGRHVLARTVETAETAFGPVRRKRAAGYGVERTKWEYDDLARIARERGMTLEDVRKALDADA